MKPSLLLLLPALALAQDTPPVPTGDACTWPAELLWHNEPEEGPWSMGVSVLNKNSGQQVPGLTTEHFGVFVDDVAASRTEGFEVRQSKGAFELATPTDESAAAPLDVDPVNYDVYFAVDLTASMAEELDVGGSKKASKLRWSLSLINSLVQPDKAGNSLFDDNDRVYISGFTDQVQAGFMTATTAERAKIREALLGINEFVPGGEMAALYSSINHNLTNIKAQAAQYRDPARRREAVLIVITDSFNGIDVATGKPLKGCNDNAPLTDELRQLLLETQEATNKSLKLYLLGLGSEAATEKYSLTGESDRRCRIATEQAATLDAYSLRALGDRSLSRGGYKASLKPAVLGQFVRRQFEALKTAYEVRYIPPEGSKRPRAFGVQVKIGDQVCQDVDVLQTKIIPQATAEGVKTSPAEVGLFLAGLILALFFLPRSMVNLGNLGSSSSSPAPKKTKGRKGKRRRRR